ncbi:MAG: hypothetical protein ACOCU2_00845 [Bacillota bacterium]
MLERYFENIREMLNRFDISPAEKADIVEDYKTMADHAKDKGLSDKEVIDKLGDVEHIFHALKHEYELKSNAHKGDKIIRIMPFIAIILFFGLGFGFELWHPGWLVFLLIPSTSIIVKSMQRPGEFYLAPLMPFISLVAFFILGFVFKAWHPAWIVFLLIPMVAILESANKKNLRSSLVSASVFIGFSAFIIIGVLTNTWHPTWLVLLLPLLVGSFTGKHPTTNIIILIILLVSIGIYLYLGLETDLSWTRSLIAFAPYLIVGVMFDRIQIIGVGHQARKQKGNAIKATFLLSVVLFFLIGELYNAYAISWLVFLLIPIVATIIVKRPLKLTPMMPSIAVIAFFLLGYFLDAWHIAWLVFLLIPITSILES